MHHYGEDLRGRVVAMCGAGSSVELVSDGIELGLSVDGQIGALGEVLPQQAVGVLAGAALPGAVRIAEVDSDAGLLAELGVQCHFLALVVGEGLAHGRCDAGELGTEGRQGGGCRAVRHLGEQHQPGAALDQHGDGRAVAGTLDQIAFPVSGHDPVVHFRRTHVDADGLCQVSTPILAPRPGAPLAAALPQTGDQLAPQLPLRVSVDRGVDRLVRDLSVRIIGPHAAQCASDLFGRPAPFQQGADNTEQHAVGCKLWWRSSIKSTRHAQALRR